MKKALFATLFALTLTLIFANAASAQKSVAGEWDATFNTPGGPQSLKLVLKVDGEKLTGTAKRSRGDVALTVTIKGEDITFAYGPDDPIEIQLRKTRSELFHGCNLVRDRVVT